MEVMAFKLTSGDEIIAEVTSVNRGSKLLTETSNVGTIESYTVRHPHTIQFQPVGNGQLGLALVPWTLSNPTIHELELPATAVLLPFPPSENVKRQYVSQTTGLALPPAGTASRISK